MRILFDGYSLLAPRSGIGHYTYQLIRALARTGTEHQFIALCLHGGPPSQLVQSPEFPETNVRVAREPWLLHQLARAARRLGVVLPVGRFIGTVDIFHAPNYVFTRPVRSARRVVTIHDVTLLLFPEWHPRKRVRQMGRELTASAHAADHIIADSHSTKNDIVTHLEVSPDRVTVVPLAADPSFQPLPRPDVERALGQWGLSYGGYLLFVGTIEPRKNLETLLDAIDVAGGRLGPLVLAGPAGWAGDVLRDRLARASEAGRLRYLGYVSDAVRPILMNGARAFVYPSLYEGFGLPPLEAMACGTPVLVSRASSLPEVVGDAGLLVDPLDAAQLTAGLCRLWEDDKLRHDLRERGLERAARFSWDMTARATLAVYERLF